MQDNIDMIYSMFVWMEEKFQERFLGKFPVELYGEPSVWHGCNMHTFYELTYCENNLYVFGNLDKSIFRRNVVLSAKLISPEVRKGAVLRIHEYRMENTILYAELVEEICMCRLDLRHFTMRDKTFPANYESGVEKAIEKILEDIPEINPSNNY